MINTNAMKKLVLYLMSVLVFGNTTCASGDSVPVAPDEDPVFTKMPDSFTEEIEQAGKLITESYSTRKEDGSMIHKTVTVYLPYQYNPSREYEILYLMHGGGGNISTLLGSPGKGNLYYLEVEDGLRDYDWYAEYLYNILPLVF